jgi:hypothetical protein
LENKKIKKREESLSFFIPFTIYVPFIGAILAMPLHKFTIDA